MNILSMDTTGNVCSVAVSVQDTILAEEYVNCFQKGFCDMQAKKAPGKRTHSQLLLPMIDSCLAKAGMTVGDVDVFCVVHGPGSFTGIRIGVCTAKGLAHATGKHIVEVSALDCLRAGAPAAQKVCALMDARAGRVYAAAWKDGEKFLPDCASTVEEVLLALPEDGFFFTGDGAVAYQDRIRAVCPGASFQAPWGTSPRASFAALLAWERGQKGKFVTAEDAAPLYLREAQAVKRKEQG